MAQTMSLDEYEAQFPMKAPDDTSLIVKKVHDKAAGQLHIYTINLQGQLHGLYRIYMGISQQQPHGHLVMECSFAGGLKHGQQLEWNLANGVMMRDINFRYGLLHGSYKEYDTAYITLDVDADIVPHFLKVHCTYYMNRLHGPFIKRDVHNGRQTIRYYRNGELCIYPSISRGKSI